MAKSLFQKLGLVESEEKENYSAEELETMLNQTKGVTTEDPLPEGINTEDLVSIVDIYEKYNMSDISKSIFKVNEISSIPGISSLPTDVKRQSVIGVLAASGLSPEDLAQDGVDRINAIESTLTAFNNETNDIVAENENLISEYQSKIDEAKKAINERKLLQEQQEKLSKEETSKINEIVKFIKPVIQ